MITVEMVQEIISSGGLAYPYPRRGQISINGGRGQQATKQAIKLAQNFLKSKGGK